MPDPTVAAVAIGSNLGDRDAHVRFAFERLAGLLDNLKISSVHETVPVETPSSQPLFLNAAAVGVTTLGPRELLSELLAIERAGGRTRPFQHAPRTLDLDLVLLGNEVWDETELTIPHPRFRERAFVLEPLAEIAPDLRDPVSGQSVEELLKRLRRGLRAPLR